MSATSNGERTIAVVLYPGLAALDFIGPLQVLKTLEQFEPRYKVVVVAARREPIGSDVPMHMIADATFEEVPHPYALVVPGGRIPTVRAMSDPAIRAYVRTAADSAETVASVCTGSLILAAVGLLDGRQATTNWFWSGVLGQFGATYVQARWVEDGKFIMSAGVSAGIDMALVLVSRLTDEATARRVQLALDYDPQPPFGGIDWANVPRLPRLIRGGIRLAAPVIAARPRRLTTSDRQVPLQVPSPSPS
jgi:transcriptional regulator GlxA family with amidase domain